MNIVFEFQSTPSARRATEGAVEEGSTAYVFQSTPSARRATVFVAQLARGRGNFNPRPPRGGRHEKPVVDEKPVVISIHALREEGDLQGGRLDPGTDHFNPRPPRGGRRRAASANSRTYGNFNPRPPRGGRLISAKKAGIWTKFQSTPSARRATADCQKHSKRGKFQSTPSARRATAEFAVLHQVTEISIHALREEGDVRALMDSYGLELFQSTPSARRATSWLANTA